MRILLVSSWYPPILSGSSLWAESLVFALRKRGHDVHVVTTQWENLCHTAENDGGGIVHRLPARLFPRNRFLQNLSIIPIACSFANRKRMLDIVKNFKPDIIHQINHIFDTLFLSAYISSKTNIPLVGSITTPIQSSSPFVNRLMHFLDAALLYHFRIRQWKRIICSDSTQARYALDTYGHRIENRIVTRIFVGIHERIRKGRTAAKPPWPHIVMVGHVHEIRNPMNVIRAMPAILERFPNARLDIAGRIQFEKSVQEVERLGLGASVHFLGEVPSEKVSELVSSAHVFVVLHQCSR